MARFVRLSPAAEASAASSSLRVVLPIAETTIAGGSFRCLDNLGHALYRSGIFNRSAAEFHDDHNVSDQNSGVRSQESGNVA